MDEENHSFRINSDKDKLPCHPKELGKKEFAIMAVDVKEVAEKKQLSKEGIENYNLSRLTKNKGERMKAIRIANFLKALSLIVICVLIGPTPSLSLAETNRSLYERLGGYDAISAVVDVFLIKVWEDPVVGRFFVGMGTDTRNQLRQKNKNLMCANTGGPCKKINRPLAEAHVGLGVTDKEFDIVVSHLGTTLKEFKVPQKEYDELMTKVGGLRDYVVEARIKK